MGEVTLTIPMLIGLVSACISLPIPVIVWLARRNARQDGQIAKLNEQARDDLRAALAGTTSHARLNEHIDSLTRAVRGEDDTGQARAPRQRSRGGA